MEFIMISDSKLKIALTPADMKEYSLDCETIDYDKTETRAAFWQFFDDVKLRTGFDAASDRIFVQIYSSVGGGCEMYVTKLAEEPEADIQEPEAGEQREKHPLSIAVNDPEAAVCCGESALPYEKDYSTSDEAANNNVPSDSAQRYIYRTESIGELLGLCGYLGGRNDIAASSAYSDPMGGRYYLMIETLARGRGIIPLSAYLDEYGEPCPSGAEMYIAEHMNCICRENAVGILADLM